FKRQMMQQALRYGVAYAQIVRVDGRVTALWPLETSHMRVDRTDTNVKRWTYTARSNIYTWLFDASMPPIFELTIDTPVVRCKELIGPALAVQEYVARFFSNGARPAGALVTAQSLPEQARKNLREAWVSRFGGASR